MKKEKKIQTKDPNPNKGVADIIKKVRELEIKSKKLTSDLFTGEYHSAFKGKGMSFKEVREYTHGEIAEDRYVSYVNILNSIEEKGKSKR